MCFVKYIVKLRVITIMAGVYLLVKTWIETNLMDLLKRMNWSQVQNYAHISLTIKRIWLQQISLCQRGDVLYLSYIIFLVWLHGFMIADR